VKAVKTSEQVSYTCQACSFSLWLPIARLGVSSLGLYDDARFPGRCILVLHRHQENFAMLDRKEASDFTHDLQRAAQAILAVTGAPRMNYALLGNKEPHIHFHMIPRQETDPVFHLTPWHHPEPRRDLAPEVRIALSKAIAEILIA
jgi:diadenosine tetraphosphate (Ap4A) HIT family hydrolase